MDKAMNTVQVKICGLTNAEDAGHAVGAGADFIGFVLYSGSPRGITADLAGAIVAGLPKSVRAIGVFVNESRENVIKTALDCGFYAVQLHGDERTEDFVDMPVRLWRAVRFERHVVVPDITAWVNAERYLVDAAAPGQYGGAGITADWDAAAALAAEHQVMLAGGLTLENVEAGIRAVRPVGVDVSSGVESAPGRKDRAKVEAFVAKVRGQ